MQIDFNYCIIEQMDTKERIKKRDAQSVADIIFKATEHRMSGFECRDFVNDMYYPLEGMTQKERGYCLKNDSKIEQNLNTVTYNEHLREMFENTKKNLNEMIKKVKSKK